MRPYEIMVIIDPEVDDRQVAAVYTKALEGLEKAGGTIDNVELWGRRKLAYEIKKKAEATYVVINVTAEPAQVKEMDRQYTLNEKILRTKVIRPDLHK
ncbi:MAG: 30S ribosomal protein S6 [Propionibacteriaceae bacterium]|nr:30S ribosomal protein S6 [Micropruina sp.]HBX82472.1 30S ribosomal protein S6 [Propionibacteriaceae bacterium]HBY23481.1 30S ribosomal protein S6 [Propionibacteriaceae bacterium]